MDAEECNRWCIARLEPHLAKNGRAWSLFCLRPCAELLRCCLQTSGMMRVQHSNKEGDSYLVISLSPCSPTVPTLSTFFGDIERSGKPIPTQCGTQNPNREFSRKPKLEERKVSAIGL